MRVVEPTPVPLVALITRVTLLTRVALPALVVALSACGIKDKLEQRVQEEVAEKVIELAAEDEDAEVEIQDGKLTIEGADGARLESDPDAQTTTVRGANGDETTIGTKLPADFPLPLPASSAVHMAQRTVTADGAKTFAASVSATSSDLDALAAELRADLEQRGFEIKENTIAGPNGRVIHLIATTERVDASCTVATSTDSDHPGASIVVSWAEKPGG